TMTQITRRGDGTAATRSARVATSVVFGSMSNPVTSIPAARRRSAMFPPMRPRPTMPMCIWIPLSKLVSLCRSARETDRHQQIAERGLVVALELRLTGHDGRLRRMGERHPDERGGQRPETVEKVERVERGRDVLAGEGRLERLGGLRVVPLPRLEDHLAFTERHPHRGVSFGHQA